MYLTRPEILVPLLTAAVLILLTIGSDPTWPVPFFISENIFEAKFGVADHGRTGVASSAYDD